jgi:DNA-binding response OmpR family regulator
MIDDDRDLCCVVLDWLTHDGYSADAVYDGDSGRQQLMEKCHDIYIVDWDLPHVSGVSLCQEYRKNGGQSPILILTGKVGIDSKEIGLDSGADDYLTKPFDVKELSARLRALLRRPKRLMVDNVLKFGDIELDTATGRVTRDNQVIELQKTEYALLERMLRHQKTIMKSEDLISYLWPAGSEAGDGALRMTIKRLRDKIDVEGKPSIIESMKRVGYRLRSPQ